MGRWYGSVQNRLEENRQFCDEIEVGTGVTEYSWSDREAYEVIAVKDQKHFTMRKYDHKHIGEAYENKWELISNPDNPEYEMTKRGKYWYFTATWTREEVEREIAKAKANVPDCDELLGALKEARVYLALAQGGFDYDTIMEKGKQTKYRKANISIGKADYYYDYEF